MTYIYKDYQIIAGTLYKFKVDDNKHLIHQFGSVPCIDAANVWDKHSNVVKKIRMRTKKGRMFRIDAEVFDKNKKEVDWGWGKQYYVDKELWDITEPKKAREVDNRPQEDIDKQVEMVIDTFGGREIDKQDKLI